MRIVGGRAARHARIGIATAAAAVLFGASLLAITAGDVLEKMSQPERFGYISGAVDMAIFQASDSKDESRATCIRDWYYAKGAKGPAQVISSFERYRELTATGIIQILIERACGPAAPSARDTKGPR